MSSCGIVVPAYMGSTRFPGKPLADVGGRPLLSYAVEAARESGLPYCVATSDEEIIEWCLSNEVILGNTQRITKCGFRIRNGTERASIVNRYRKWDRVIVLQCDEPDVTGEDLRSFTHGWLPETFACVMQDDDWGNPNSVSVAVKDDIALFFQRAAPHGAECCRLRHVGVYVYHCDMLANYLSHGPSGCEVDSSLEQLRTMAMGHAWHVRATTRTLRSVNVPEDVEQFKDDARKPLSRPE